MEVEKEWGLKLKIVPVIITTNGGYRGMKCVLVSLGLQTRLVLYFRSKHSCNSRKIIIMAYTWKCNKDENIGTKKLLTVYN